MGMGIRLGHGNGEEWKLTAWEGMGM